MPRRNPYQRAWEPQLPSLVSSYPMGLSLRNRILLAFAMSFALFLGAMGYGTYQLRALGVGLEVLNEGYLPLARMGAQLETHQERLDLAEARRDSSRSLAAFRSNAPFHAAVIASVAARGRKTAESAHELSIPQAERLALEEIQGQLSLLIELAHTYESSARHWLALEEQERDSEPVQTELIRLGAGMEEEVKDFNASVDAAVRRVNVGVGRSQARATVVGVVLAALALAIGLVLMGWTLVTLRPIGRLTAEVQRVADGDYSGHVDVQGAHEIGVLATEFNAMARALAERDRRLLERAQELERLSGYLRSVLDTIRAGLAVAVDGRVTMANPAAHELWGVEEGLPLPDTLSVEPGRHAAHAIGEARFDLQVVPFAGRGRLVVGEEVTERLATQERLERSERLALIGQMLAQITHEVRNPLNAISLNAELLGEEIAGLGVRQDAEAVEILATIIQEIHRLEQVTEHYLDLARRPAPSIDTENLASLVGSVCRLEEPAFQRGGVQLVVQVPDAPVQVSVDGNQLRRALLNVLHNALQSGATRVTVQVEATQREATVTVADDGQGMDPDALEHAFDPFFSRRSKGTGLGLAITRQIMEEHGGHVLAWSAPDEGFHVRLGLPR